MLPFSYIVDEKNFALIKKTELHGYADKAVPIITYENVGSLSAVSAKITEMSEKSLLLCLYNERCIDNESREKYIKELEERSVSTNKNIKLLENEARELARHKDAYSSFNYSAAFYPALKQSLTELNEKKKAILKRISEIPAELSAHNNTITESEKAARVLESRIADNIENVGLFDEYIKKYPDHLNDKRAKSDSEKAIRQNKARTAQIAEELTALENEIGAVSEKRRRTENDILEAQKKLSALDDTVTGKRLPLPVEQLEAEYRFMTDNVRSTREKLEREIEESVKSAKSCGAKLKRLAIPAEEYSDPSLIFSDELLDRAENAVTLNERHLSECDDKLKKRSDVKSRLGGVAETKKDDLEKAGYREPLEPARIKMEFDKRKSELLEKNKVLKKAAKEYDDIRENCALKSAALKDQFVDELYSGKYIPADVSEINADELKRSLDDKLKKKASLENALRSNYETVRQRYTPYGYEAIDAFINNMNFDEQNSFDGFFEVFDHIKECQKCLEEELELIKNDLEQVENKKTNFIRHALDRAQKIYSEVKNISNLSRIKIDGKPRKMLVIGVPENADSRCEENMRAYLEKFLADIRAANAAEPLSEQKLLRRIANVFSDRELLNIVIGTRQIGVSLYKVDITGNNGGIRTWEEVCVENSGAQKFVSAFAFIATLLEYTRGKRMEKMGAEKMSGRKAFILDNPFGATSSEKFLDVMQALSEKFDIQLICFSDLHQSSITNKFNVFYQLALKNSLYANRASLKISEVKINGDIHKNINLEHAFARIGQITLF